MFVFAVLASGKKKNSLPLPDRLHLRQTWQFSSHLVCLREEGTTRIRRILRKVRESSKSLLLSVLYLLVKQTDEMAPPKQQAIHSLGPKANKRPKIE
jgi:hypothetical protein